MTRVIGINAWGVRVEGVGAIVADEQTIERLRVAIVCKLRQKRLSYRAIGKILGASHEHLRQRYRSLDDDERQRYEQMQLG